MSDRNEAMIRVLNQIGVAEAKVAARRNAWAQHEPSVHTLLSNVAAGLNEMRADGPRLKVARENDGLRGATTLTIGFDTRRLAAGTNKTGGASEVVASGPWLEFVPTVTGFVRASIVAGTIEFDRAELSRDAEADLSIHEPDSLTEEKLFTILQRFFDHAAKTHWSISANEVEIR